MDFSIVLKEIYTDKSKVDNSNIPKLIQIVEYWFWSLDKFIELAGEQELQKLEDLLKVSPNNSLVYAIDQYFHGQRYNKKVKETSIRFNIFYFLVAKFFLSLLRNNLYFIPKKKSEKFASFFEVCISRSNILALDNEDKLKFIRYVIDKGNYSETAISFIKKNLPNSFFKYIKYPKLRLKEATIHCAPNIFLSSYRVIELLFVFNSLSINGFQHGAGYGAWKINKYEELEESISDNFNLWFPHSNSIHYFRKSHDVKNNNINIYWVGRKQEDSVLLKDMIPYLHQHLQQVQHLPLIDEEFSVLENFYFCPYPIKERAYLPIKSRIKENLQIEQIIDIDNDILIFDNLSETTLFFALKYFIPFVIILHNSDIPGLQNKYESLLNTLRNQGLIFYSEEIKEASKFVLGLQNRSNRDEVSKKIKNLTSSSII